MAPGRVIRAMTVITMYIEDIIIHHPPMTITAHETKFSTFMPQDTPLVELCLLMLLNSHEVCLLHRPFREDI